jgi:hypothetical protein
MRLTLAITLTLLATLSGPRSHRPGPRPPDRARWIITASGGLALTSGNKDTFTVNANYDVVYDPKTRNVVKSEGLWIRGKSDGELTATGSD